MNWAAKYLTRRRRSQVKPALSPYRWATLKQSVGVLKYWNIGPEIGTGLFQFKIELHTGYNFSNYPAFPYSIIPVLWVWQLE